MMNVVSDDLDGSIDRAKTKGLWRQIMELREEVRFLRQQGDALVAENRRLRAELNRETSGVARRIGD